MKLSPDTPITYLITNGKATDVDFDASRSRIAAIVAHAADAGIDLIQVREKNLSARLLFELTCLVVEVTRKFDTRVLVNDRVDIAFAAGADGVHLAANSLPVSVIRKHFSREFIVGVSAHSIDEVVTAAYTGADFTVFGPVFQTPGKPNAKGAGALQEACSGVEPFPVLAIGGVDADNVKEVLSAGASGVAAVRALNDADSMHSLLRKLK